MKNNGMFDKVVKEVSIQAAIIAMRKEDIKSATEILVNANERLNNDADLLYLLLDIYGKTENYGKILEVVPNFVEITANEFYLATGKFFQAYAKEKLGKSEEAKSEYRKLTRDLRKYTIQTPSFYEGYIYRLLCHAKIGEYEEAFKLADYIQDLYPDKADAHAFRYMIYKERGNVEEAEKEKKLVKMIDADFKL